MSYAAQITKSLFGRQLGLRQMSSAQIGSSHPHDLLVGAEGVQRGVSTSVSTAEVIPPFGIRLLSTVSSGVHTLAAPIPGVEVTILNPGGATEFVKTQNSETMESSRGSTFTVARFVSSNQAVLHLIGVTTARWAINGMAGDSGDSANGPAITLATST